MLRELPDFLCKVLAMLTQKARGHLLKHPSPANLLVDGCGTFSPPATLPADQASIAPVKTVAKDLMSFTLMLSSCSYARNPMRNDY